MPKPASVALFLALALGVYTMPAAAAGLPCKPCAGLVVDSPQGVAEALRAQAGLKPGAPFYAAWEVPLVPAPASAAPAPPVNADGAPAAAAAKPTAAPPPAPPVPPAEIASAAPAAATTAAETASAAAAIAQAGGTPWLGLVFRTPPPLAAHAARLQGELEIAAAVARAAPAGSVLQVLWRPEGQEAGEQSLAEYAFLLKRAAVALTGARPDGRVATEPLPATAAAIAGLDAQEVAAYVDILTLAPPAGATPESLAPAIAAAAKADPGRPLALEAQPLPAEPAQVLADATRWAVAGVDLTLFRFAAEASAAAPAGPTPPAGQPTPATLAPFALLAREFAGDVSYDADSSPTGAAQAWSFVRGKDLALRVIAVTPPGGESGVLTLHFADGSLRRPTRFPLSRARVEPPAGQATATGLDLTVAAPGAVAVVGLERPTAAERGQGVSDKVTVSSTHEIPVEEILRRLQAFEDAQERRLDHYRAVDTTHLRFQVAGTSSNFDATLEGPYFFRRGGETDWAWQTFYINGVRWRGKSIPEIPLIQPEKAAALPLQIHFNKEYRYRLRGSATIDGRDAWVIDFAPAGADLAKHQRLYQGTVWVDRQLYARLRSRAVELGLSGEVLSSEETWIYSPIDAAGRAVPWPVPAARATGASDTPADAAADIASDTAAEPAAFVLPLHVLDQQILSLVGSSTVVERETFLTQVEINGAGFDEARKALAASDVTMVRDTDSGLRYLVKDKSGQRVVQQGGAQSKLFAVGGVYYDNALSYPLPLAGLNYFNLDYKKSGDQVNVFFAGALANGSIAQPHLAGSKVEGSASVFLLAVPLTDSFFAQGREIRQQDVRVLPANVGLHLGRPLGNFWKATFDYGLSYNRFNRTDATAGNFRLPSDNFLSSFALGSQFARSGYRLNVDGSYNVRSQWAVWGLPGNPDFNPEDKSFYRWDASFGKSWYLPKFQKISAEVDYDSGSRLDRFSKYQFGFFGDTRVHGYQSDEVRATTATAAHLTYGFEIGEAFRIDAVGDIAVATDRETGLDQRVLAGTGIAGTFIGPWQTIVNLDLGVPVAGPDHGFALYLVFLKLFK